MLTKWEAMLRLSNFCKSKYIWSVGYGSMECDDSVEWSFGCLDYEWYVLVPDKEWLIWVPDIDWIVLKNTIEWINWSADSLNKSFIIK